MWDAAAPREQSKRNERESRHRQMAVTLLQLLQEGALSREV
jgi:hypothetical protein